MRILVAEDDPRMARLLRQGLEEEGFTVSLAKDGLEAVEMGTGFEFEVILLDLMLPKLDGFEVTRRLRSERNQTPILMLTARDALPDLVNSLNLGADDYVTKPFSFDELIARLRAVSRRGQISQPVRLRVGDLVLDTATREVWRGEQLIELSPREFGLLNLLMRLSGQVVSRDRIIAEIWGPAASIETNTVDAFVRLLRNKIEASFPHKLISTVRGVGYMIRASRP